MERLTVKAWFDAKDTDTKEIFAQYKEIRFVVEAETHEQAIEAVYNELNYKSAKLEAQTGYIITYGYTYTEQTL